MKTCIACGMPMVKHEDFALGDMAKGYCHYCARPDGSMQSYEEKLESLAGFVIKTQGLDVKAARDVARDMMARLPAWSAAGQDAV